MDRRRFINIAGVASSYVVLSGSLSSCAGTYRPNLINKIWYDMFDFNTADKMKRALQLVRCGIMAPSSHNTQPWLFRVSENQIELLPDFSRRLPVTDPHDREFFISLGCCLENILSAATKFNFSCDYTIDADSAKNFRIIIKLGDIKNSDVQQISLFPQILERQTTRNEYDGKKIGEDILESLNKRKIDNEVAMLLVTDKKYFDLFLKYQKEANRLLYNNRNYTDELKSWLRYSDSEAEEKLDGLYSRAMGNPSTPRFIGNIYFDLFVTASSREKYDEKMLRSSPAMIFFFAGDTQADWINTGRQVERTLLNITGAKLKYAFHNESCEIDVLRKDFASDFGFKGLFPQIALRLGYADYLPRSPRRHLEDVIIKNQ